MFNRIMAAPAVTDCSSALTQGHLNQVLTQ
jgi:hypothetical protein